ncbi:RluA family pseudouridine synthase [Rhodovibrionaceae bacterium A322]
MSQNDSSFPTNGESPDSPADDAASRHVISIAEGEVGERLDRLLARRLSDFSRNRLKSLIELGAVTLISGSGGTITEASTKVKSGQTFAIIIPEAEEAEPVAQDIPLDIVYEDDEVVVINKPVGLVVHPAPGNPDSTLVNALLAHCGDSLQGIGGVKRPGIVHRLDKDTSGLMIAAKSDRAQQDLTEQFSSRSIQRRYQALVWGLPKPTEGEVDAPVGRNPRNRKKMAVVSRNGKAAITRYKVLESFCGGAVSLIECKLLTGRTHQIRVHMTHLGHPLLGDPLYGRSSPTLMKKLPSAAQAKVKALPGQALHARVLGFKHPVTEEELLFTRDLPSTLQDLINTFL